MDDPLVRELVTGLGDAANKVAHAWRSSGQHLLRLEGFMGVGKSTVASLIAEQATVRIIHTDDFAVRSDAARTYREAVDLAALRAAATEVLSTGEKVIFDGVCLEQVLPSDDFGKGYRVYLKRVSLPVPEAPLWHDIYDLEREEAEDPLHASIIQYHRDYAPHEHSDLSFAIPEGCD